MYQYTQVGIQKMPVHGMLLPLSVNQLFSTMYDLIIIGGGPAGASAAVYAARKRLKTLQITQEWGGQSTESTDIQNWIGTPSISGADFARSLESHVNTYANDCVTVLNPATVTAVVPTPNGTITVTTDSNETHVARAVLVASGSRRRKLNIPGAATYEHKGVTYCASCDGPMFTGQRVAVIGGGNAGFESAAQLQAYTEHVTIIQRNKHFKADPITVERVLSNENVTGLTDVTPIEIHGEQFVTGLTYRHASGETETIPVSGIFVEIGLLPNTDFVCEQVECDELGRIKIDPWNQRTSVSGIWAAGDCTNILFHQNNISAGNAVTALEDIYLTLRTT